MSKIITVGIDLAHQGHAPPPQGHPRPSGHHDHTDPQTKVVGKTTARLHALPPLARYPPLRPDLLETLDGAPRLRLELRNTAY